MDEQYCQERSRFIPYAVKYANDKVGLRYPKGANLQEREAWYIEWNHTYFGRMDQLWEQWLQAKSKYEKKAQAAIDTVYRSEVWKHFERLAHRMQTTVEEMEQEEEQAVAV